MAEKEKKQKMRYGINEIGIIKSVFADNLEVCLALRKVFLLVPLDKEESDILKIITDNKETVELMSKTFNPKLDLNAPLHQMIDLYSSVETKEETPEQVRLNLMTQSKLIELIERGILRLESPQGKVVSSIINYKPNYNGSLDDLYVEITARNKLIGHIDFQISQLVILAGKKEETPEETVERLRKNSTK